MRVLIIDDSFIIRRAIKHSLENEHIVCSVASAQEAIAVIDSEPVDLVIMNPMLTHNSGIELLYEIHSHTDLKHIMTILVVANPSYFVGYLDVLERLNVKAIIPMTKLSPSEILLQVSALEYASS